MRQAALLAACIALGILLPGCTTGQFVDGVSNPGSAAKALVDPKMYPKMVVEIDHPQGHGPNMEALAVLRNALIEATARPAGDIQFIQDASIPAEPNKKYSYSEIEQLEQQHRDHHSKGDTVVLYMVYVAGGHQDDSDNGRVLGAAYRGTSLVIFKGNINDASKGSILDPRPDVQCIERAVLVHEFGHAAGLVNLVEGMNHPREDPNNRGHSSNKNSVMHHAIENTANLFNLLGTNCSDIPHQFDADDKAALKALREK